jgi:hypothetical protein
VHLGDAERVTVQKFYPGYLDRTSPTAPPPAGPPSQVGRFYLREPVSADADMVVFDCRFDLTTDSYLTGHTVRGVPTLPGTFVTELAGEAALALIPGWQVVAFTDLKFHHFLQVHPRVPGRPKRIAAHVVRRTDELVTVQVEITTDVLSPTGVLLVKDKPHFRATVLLARRFPTAPHWSDWPEDGAVAVPDPYHVPSAQVLLTGPFVATANTRHTSMGKRATYAPELSPDDPVWSRFVMPSILLDGLARTGVLTLVDGHLVPVAAPLSIRRIDLYQAANDLRLLAEHGRLELYATPADFTMQEQVPDNRFVATTPNGLVVAQMKDITATVIGYYDTRDGRLLSPERTPLSTSEPMTARDIGALTSVGSGQQ